MKKQKLRLDELKVQSFVTHFDKQQNQTQDINGGGTGAANRLLVTHNIICDLASSDRGTYPVTTITC
jgi:hypothetical protein